MANPRVLVLFGSEPDPVLLERARSLNEAGYCDVYFAYWRRRAGKITIPYTNLIPRDRFVPIDAPNPQGNTIKRLALHLWFALKFRCAMKRVNPAAIYALNINMVAVAKLAKLGRSKPALIYEFQDQYGARMSYAKRTAYRICASGTALTVFQSPHVQANYITDNGLDKVSEPNIVCPPAPARWDYRYDGRRLKDPQLTVGYFGYIRNADVLRVLTEAARRVAAEGHPLKLRFAGTGGASELISEHKDEPWLAYSGVFEYFSEYRDLFSQADVIFSCYSQTLPNNVSHIARRFAEAIVSGVPVIVAEGSYMAELVRKHRCGWVVDSTSVDSMADVLRRVCRNPRERDLSSVPREFVDWLKFETHEEAYRKAIQAVVAR